MAIALDNSGQGTAGSSTMSYTNNGNGLFVCVNGAGSVVVPTVTYGGVSMTNIASYPGSNNVQLNIYFLFNPATGSNTISVTHSYTGLRIYAISYTGVSAFQPDSSAIATGTTGETVNTTVVASNCWLLGFGGQLETSGSSTVSSNKTSRQNGTFNGLGVSDDSATELCDSNGTVSTGSQGIVFSTATGNDASTGIVISVRSNTNDTVYTLTASVGSFVLSFISAIVRIAFGWRNTNKNSSTWINQNKN